MLVRDLIKDVNVKTISEQDYQLLEFALILEELDTFNDDEILSEGVLDMVKGKLDGVAGKLKDMGFEFHNTKPGLIQVLAKGGKTFLKAFLLGLAATKAKAAKDTDKLETLKADMKAIAKDVKVAFTQENVVDILMQLDQATAHLVTGPIHMFSALTGVHILLPWESKGAHGGEHNTDDEKGVGLTTIITSTISSLKDKISKILNPEKAAEASAALDKVAQTVETTTVAAA